MTREDLLKLKELTRTRGALVDRIAQLRESAVRTTALLDGLPKGSTMRSAIEEAVVKIVESTRELELTLIDYHALRAKLNSELESTTPLESEIMRQRYLDGRNFKAIAASMNTSVSRVFQLHRRAIKKISSECSKL